MKKAALLVIAVTILISYQAAAWAACGQSGTKCVCKTNFKPGNKHAAAPATK